MEIVNVGASRNYSIYIGSGLADVFCGVLHTMNHRAAAIVSDDYVFGIYGERLAFRLGASGVRTECFMFVPGEKSKRFSVYEALSEWLCEKNFDRGDCIIALGGGVAGDIAGFAAATYRRGIGLIQLPTSLLAMTDSSVGGKNGINLKNGKNAVGCFYQPEAVFCDTDFLRTLPKDEMISAYGEIIKYAMLPGGGDLIELLNRSEIGENAEKIISRCLAIKAALTEKDEYDRGDRIFLNFGHTFGHAAEVLSGYEIPHGRAVAMGMAFVTEAAERNGGCAEGTLDMLVSMLKKAGLDYTMPFSAEELEKVIPNDKKCENSVIKLVIPEGVGRLKTENIPIEELGKWLKG